MLRLQEKGHIRRREQAGPRNVAPRAVNRRMIAVSSSVFSLAVSFFRFLLLVGTCLAFVPALRLIYQNKRHFELYIGVFQLLAAVM